MVINNRNETLDDVSLHIDGGDLENVNAMEYLGVVIDNKLNMKKQYIQIQYIGENLSVRKDFKIFHFRN